MHCNNEIISTKTILTKTVHISTITVCLYLPLMAEEDASRCHAQKMPRNPTSVVNTPVPTTRGGRGTHTGEKNHYPPKGPQEATLTPKSREGSRSREKGRGGHGPGQRPPPKEGNRGRNKQEFHKGNNPHINILLKNKMNIYIRKWSI